jgi:haloalkane dehalogenase
MAHYLEPFPTVASRLPVRQWPREIPIDGDPADVQAAVESYAQWLGETNLPKLLFYATPGGLIPRPLADKLLRELPNIEGVDIGKGIHYVQEDNPHGIGAGLADWYAKMRG